MFSLGSQRTKKAFRNWLRHFIFVYQITHSYVGRLYVPPGPYIYSVTCLCIEAVHLQHYYILEGKRFFFVEIHMQRTSQT